MMASHEENPKYFWQLTKDDFRNINDTAKIAYALIDDMLDRYQL
ncbi:hypothetical protein SAMN00768000_0137 [Sulfobacillus thermosulfidooxidans DSM 9293]|uniref:Uncharacterized protein n=1 Tax=Sulfobacillus thermosulfidooxidans (strain DSM 9293 / VKM B-1269 / AT-1) TaxID=929705 RepID=A0A1W1W759_SULTA|nr:hypothetical protein SAMN00768000_0137 [Sulfobacillus thermosulfidooxidans DSM 9293]